MVKDDGDGKVTMFDLETAKSDELGRLYDQTESIQNTKNNEAHESSLWVFGHITLQ